MGKKSKEIDDGAVQASIIFTATVAVGSFFLGIYNLLGLESAIPFLKPIAELLGLWWFGVAAGAAALCAFTRFATKLP